MLPCRASMLSATEIESGEEISGVVNARPELTIFESGSAEIYNRKSGAVGMMVFGACTETSPSSRLKHVCNWFRCLLIDSLISPATGSFFPRRGGEGEQRRLEESDWILIRFPTSPVFNRTLCVSSFYAKDR